MIVLGTGSEEENMRTALWLRKKAPRARIIARSSKHSQFASEVGRDNDIITVSIAELVEENIPADWVTVN